MANPPPSTYLKKVSYIMHIAVTRPLMMLTMIAAFSSWCFFFLCAISFTPFLVSNYIILHTCTYVNTFFEQIYITKPPCISTRRSPRKEIPTRFHTTIIHQIFMIFMKVSSMTKFFWIWYSAPYSSASRCPAAASLLGSTVQISAVFRCQVCKR